jgi:tetratricopeptide (TPR) repeat protein
MNNAPCISLLVALIFALSSPLSGQDNVFALVKTDIRLGDEYFARKNYARALELYWNVYKKNADASSVKLKIARCYYFLKEYQEAVSIFETLTRGTSPLSRIDQYCYAESQASTGNYKKALGAYREYLKRFPTDTIVAQKIWRLSNVQYLYEDSVHYVVRPLPVNTEASELCVVPYKDGIVFLSNRKEVNLVEKVDPSNAPLYKTYFATALPDSTGSGKFGNPKLFNKEVNSKLQAGPLAFFANGKKIVFVSSSDAPASQGNRTLSLYFAEEQNGIWKLAQPFPYNNNQYSLSDPAINNEGNVLYFSSDMPGGRGGKDIYRSEMVNGRWQKPENLGEVINTSCDEAFPFLHLNRTLYFASNGHPGLGGLDIFKTQLIGNQWDEVVNAGYPINSHADEFGISLDSMSAHGYFSSNRKKGGLNDDLYKVDIDLQTYPLRIDALVQVKDHNLSDSVALKPFSSARIILIDNQRDIIISESISDENGNVSIVIPYFSKYKIRVIGAENDEHILSLEIPKQRKVYSKHEIVIVKDLFRSPENEIIK